MLVSYSGRNRADVDFTKARKVQFKAWQKAANKAVAKEDKPPKPDNLREDTLYLIPGSTAEVTPEELAVIRKERKDVVRFVEVHEEAPKVPRSLKPKDESEAKPEESGDGDGDSGDGDSGGGDAGGSGDGDSGGENSGGGDAGGSGDGDSGGTKPVKRTRKRGS